MIRLKKFVPIALIFFLINTDKILCKEMPTGLDVAGLPVVSYRNDDGLKYGGRIFFYQYGDGSIQPFRWNVIANAARTTQQRLDLFLFLDFPHIFGLNSRFDIFTNFKKFDLQDYYGLGNNSQYEPDFVSKQSSHFKGERFYHYKHQWTSIRSNIHLPFLTPRMKILFGIGLLNTRISCHGDNTLFSEEKPFGIKGGRTNYYRFGIVYDKRDEEAVPTCGFWSEILFEHSTKILKSDYSYLRITFTDRRYWLLHKRLVYAQRFIYETMPGKPPFYEMTVINDSYSRFEGLGGGNSLRGVPRFLFVGPNKLLANFELRWEVVHKIIFKQSLTMYLHTFIDAGRVWLKDDTMALNNIHFSQGIGIHIRWNKDFVGAIDIGHSPFLDYAVYLTFGNLF